MTPKRSLDRLMICIRMENILVSHDPLSVDTRDFLPGGQILIVDVISESVQLHLHHDAGIKEHSE